MKWNIPQVLRSTKFQKLGLALIIAGVLTTALGFTKAATDFYSLEPEKATISGAATINDDSTASGGKYIMFGQAPNSGGGTSTPGSGSSSITGTTYYVDCNAGSDSNTGTSDSTPWSSLSKANNALLTAGDGILFKRGCNWSGNLTVKWSGNSSNPVVIGAYGTGSDPMFNRNSNGAVITVTGSYTVIQNVSLTATAPSKISSSDTKCPNSPVGNIQGVSFESGAVNNTVKNSTISNMYAGVFLKAGSNNNHVINNQLTNNNMMSPLDTTADNDAGAFGVLIWGNNNEIAYNTISGSNACSYDYDLDGSAVEIYGGSSPAASNNKIHHNKAINDNAFTELGKGSSGAIPDNNVFAYNTYYASGISNSIFLVTRGDTGSYGPITNTRMYNNTAYMVGTSKYGIYCGTCADNILTFKNNIIATTSNTPIPTNYGSNVTNNIGWIIGSSSNDPKFVNANNQDFALNSSSPAINAGTSEILTVGYDTDLAGKTVPIGNAVDIGAYEYGTTATNIGSSSKAVSSVGWYGYLGSSISKALSNLFSKLVSTIGSVFSSISKHVSLIFSTGTAEAIQADGSIVIAAVGDMNPDGNTSSTSAAGKNAAAITTGLANGSLDAFFALGDFQYQHGGCGSSSSGNWDYAQYWGKLYGSAIPKTYTIAGPTHDTTGATDDTYKKFFSGQCPGSTAKSAAVISQGGTPIDGLDFYSFDIGNWHFAALPTATWRYNSTLANSITPRLDADLAAAKASGKHLAALYHDPYFTSPTSSHDREYKVKPWIDILDKYDVRLTLSGSQHNYERSCPVLSDDRCDDATGTTAFQVSTGGIGLRTFSSSIPPSFIVKRFSDTHGWLKLTLNPDGSFSWLYNSVNGPGTDSGSRSAPSGGSGGSTSPTPDTTGPQVSITSPTNGVTVSGTSQVSVSATDDSGSIKKVEMYLDNSTTPAQTLTTSPFNFSVDTKLLSNGTHSITVKAYDPSNNVTTKTITVNVSNATCQSVASTYGSATTSVSLATTGKYRIWSRVKAPDTNNNSFYLMIDDQCPINVGDSSISANSWSWINNKDGGSTPVDIDLTSGNHALKIVGREPGVQLDRILFLTDLQCIPTNMGDNCSVDTDTTIPTISITSPTAGQTLKGTVDVTVSAKDNVGVSKVEYYLDPEATVPFATSSNSPFGTKWDTTKTTAGNHTLRAIAYDIVGNKSTEAKVSVVLSDQTAPIVSIISPTSGSVTGNVEVTLAATDNIGVTKVEAKLDNSTTLSTLTQPPYYFVWDTRNTSDGNHKLTAMAYDAAGNMTTSPIVTLSVSNDTETPSVPSGLRTTQITTSSADITWDASTDNKGVAYYNVYRGGAFVTSTTSTSYSDNTLEPNTVYYYSISAVDDAKNESAKSSPLAVQTEAVVEPAPAAPQNLNVSISNTDTVVTWDAVISATKYYIQRDGLIIGNTNTTSFTDDTVQPDQTYTYVVYAASNTGLMSDGSSSITITTPPQMDTTPPSAPVNLSYFISSNLINLDWDASTDNIGVARYKIFRNDQQIGETLTPGFGDGNVQPGISYTYYVIAIDSAGNQSNRSSSVTAEIASDYGVIKSGILADTYIDQKKYRNNFGSLAKIQVDRSPRQDILMKFSVGGLNGKVITSAKLRLWANNGSTRTGGLIYKLTTNNWDENTVNWSNAPSIDGNLITKLGPVAINSYVDIDLSDVVKYEGVYSIAFQSSSSDAAHYNSKESSSKQPELIITTN